LAHENQTNLENNEVIPNSQDFSQKVKDVSEEIQIEQKDDHNHGDQADANMSKTSSLVLVVALCTHSIFEGIAVGIQTDFDFTGYLALSIALHNFVASISLGGTFCRSGFTFKKSFGLVFAFSLSTPIGMTIGVLLSDSDPIVGVVLMSISAGTFIYVSCTEILQHEFERGLRQWLQFIFVVLGGALIIGFWFIGTATGSHDSH
jgi:zinc transporter 1/2/3